MVECVAFGIDWSTKAASLGVDRNGMLTDWRTTSWLAGVQCEGARRLAGARAQLIPFLRSAVAAFGQPDVMVVEAPFGRVAPESMQMFGVILATTAEEIECPIVTPGPGEWKLRATGYGAHRKPKRGDDFQYGVLSWAKREGYTGTSWDEADSLGCARAGALLYARDLRASTA